MLSFLYMYYATELMISELYVDVLWMKWLMMLEDTSKLSSTAVSEASMQNVVNLNISLYTNLKRCHKCNC